MTATAIPQVTFETKRGIHIASQAWIVEEDRELAWAEDHMIRNPAYKWVLGKFVQADQANQNGHIFDLGELQAGAKDSVLYAPMNMLHKPRHIVGTFVANELVYPVGAGEGPAPALPQAAAAEMAANMAVETTPYMEALAAFWKYYFPDEFDVVERAHKDGSLFFSMECVPDTVQCAMDGCNQEFAYKGRQSSTYCDHLNVPRARRHLHQPHFTAGALIVPPIRPGWKNADVKELSGLLESHAEECEMAYEAIKEATPHLGPKEWEAVMLMIAQQSDAEEAKGPDLKKIHEQNKNKPHAFVALQGDGGKSKNAPCKRCGKGSQAPIHSKSSDEIEDEGKSAVDIALEAAGVRSALDIALETVRADAPPATRKNAEKKGQTAYGDSFPVPNLDYLNRAIQSWGRAPKEKRSQLKSFLLRRARQLGASSDVIERIKNLSV